MSLPNPLASRSGRLAAFFFLYVTEGIPLGFAAIAVATQLRRQNVGVAQIGAFVGSLYLPWALKWAFGPFVDVFWSRRLGRRRGWILITQLLMVTSLLAAGLVRLPEDLWLFTIVLLVHNTFGATQDVAIDALACNTLRENERGIANGLMFAGAYVGQAIGGSLVLFLTPHLGFKSTFFFVAGCILSVTVAVVLPMREPEPPAEPHVETESKLSVAIREMRTFATMAFRSFVGSRGAFAALLFAILPVGAMSLGLALQSNLGVELGLNDDQIAQLNLGSALLSAGFCVVGGFLSDRFGRRKILVGSLVLMAIPVLALFVSLEEAKWILPVPMDLPNRPIPPSFLVTTFWIATLSYSIGQGMMYGTRSAIVMDVTNPAVAATQFTAYMALMNVAIAYTATWQGLVSETWGYPRTLALDVAVGFVVLAVLPFVRAPAKGTAARTDGGAPLRARILAVVLAIGCLAWVPYRWDPHLLGAGRPIAETFFTLAFVSAAVFLLAGGATQARSLPILSRIGAWIAPLLLLVCLRGQVPTIVSWLFTDPAMRNAAQIAADVAAIEIPLLAGMVLIGLAASPWRGLELPVAPAEAEAIAAPAPASGE